MRLLSRFLRKLAKDDPRYGSGPCGETWIDADEQEVGLSELGLCIETYCEVLTFAIRCAHFSYCPLRAAAACAKADLKNDFASSFSRRSAQQYASLVALSPFSNLSSRFSTRRFFRAERSGRLPHGLIATSPSNVAARRPSIASRIRFRYQLTTVGPPRRPIRRRGFKAHVGLMRVSGLLCQRKDADDRL